MAVEHRLVIQHGDRKTAHVLETLSTVLGRDSSCNLFFVDHKLSRRHARLEVNEGEVDLVDLGSRNGCWVNGARISRQRLHHGDILRIGSLRLHYHAEARADQAEPADAAEPAFTVASAPPESTVLLSSPSHPATMPLQSASLLGNETVNVEPARDQASTDPDVSNVDVPNWDSRASSETVNAEPERRGPSVHPDSANGVPPMRDVDAPPDGEVTTRSPPLPVVASPSRAARAQPRPGGRPALPHNRRSRWSTGAGALLFLVGAVVYLVPGLYGLFQGFGAAATATHEAENALAALVETNRPFLEAEAMTALDLSLVDRVPALKTGWILDPRATILHQHGPLSLSEALGGAAGAEPGPDGVRAGLYVLQTPVLGSDGRPLGSLLIAYDGGFLRDPKPFPSIAFVVVGLFGLVGAVFFLRNLAPLSASFSPAAVSRQPRQSRI